MAPVEEGSLKMSKKSTKKTQEDETPLGNDVFAGNIPKAVNKRDLIKKFSKFGPVTEVRMFDKEPNKADMPKFAFISFKTKEAVISAIEHDGRVLMDGNHIHIEERKPKDQVNRADQYNKFWFDLLVKFDWKEAAAIYLYRYKTMENYLCDFILAQAQVRQIKKEKIKTLMNNLIKMAETKPSDESLIDTLPPNLSGMISNLVHHDKKNKKKTINMKKDVLKGGTNLYTFDDEYVYYDQVPELPKKEAEKKFNEKMVEGLFIYFFAKFSHGPMFLIKYTYYVKSEPIRSILMTVTGQKSVNKAIEVYFDVMNEVFHFDPVAHELYLVEDYFKRTKNKYELLRPYLNNSSQSESVSNTVGIIKDYNDSKATVEFPLSDNSANTVTITLERKIFKSEFIIKEIGAQIRLNATKEREGWICTDAWIPGAKLIDLKAQFKGMKNRNEGLLTFTTPDGAEHEALFNFEKAFYPSEDKPKIDDFLYIDALPSEDKEFDVILIWTGTKPTSAQVYQWIIDRALAGGREIEVNNNVSMPEDLPEVVQNTLHNVLDVTIEIEDDQYLIDREMFGRVMNEMNFDGSVQELFEKLEKSCRLTLSEALAAYVKN